jgi:hypothetical protein
MSNTDVVVGGGYPIQNSLSVLQIKDLLVFYYRYDNKLCSNARSGGVRKKRQTGSTAIGFSRDLMTTVLTSQV